MDNSLKTTLPSSPICPTRSSYFSSHVVSSATTLNATSMKNTADKSERHSHKRPKHSRTKSCDQISNSSVVLVTPGQGLQVPPSILNNPTSATTIRVQAEISTRSSTRSLEGDMTLSDFIKTKKKSSKRQRSSVIQSRSTSCDRSGENIVSTLSSRVVSSATTLNATSMNTTSMKNTADKSERHSHKRPKHSRTKSCDQISNSSVVLVTPGQGLQVPPSILNNPTSATTIRVQAEISTRSLTRSLEGDMTLSDFIKTKKKSSKRKIRSVVQSRSKSCDRSGENIVSTLSKKGDPRTPRSILDNPTSASSIRVQAEISSNRSLRETKSSESRLNNLTGTPVSSKAPATSLITDNDGKKNMGKKLFDSVQIDHSGPSMGQSVVDWIKKKQSDT